MFRYETNIKFKTNDEESLNEFLDDLQELISTYDVEYDAWITYDNGDCDEN